MKHAPSQRGTPFVFPHSGAQSSHLYIVVSELPQPERAPLHRRDLALPLLRLGAPAGCLCGHATLRPTRPTPLLGCHAAEVRVPAAHHRHAVWACRHHPVARVRTVQVACVPPGAVSAAGASLRRWCHRRRRHRRARSKYTLRVYLGARGRSGVSQRVLGARRTDFMTCERGPRSLRPPISMGPSLND